MTTPERPTEDDLVKRLRSPGKLHGTWLAAMDEAADRIEADSATIRRLEAEKAEVEGSLQRILAAIAVKGGDEHSPTMDAYLLACAAIEKHRARAEAAEARVTELEGALRRVKGYLSGMTDVATTRQLELIADIATALRTKEGQ